MRILVIEDEPTLLGQIKDYLVADGFMIDTATDGEDGLHIATEFPIDAAVIDLGLPKMDGIEVIKQIRAQGNALPILILTARDNWKDKVSGLEAGADDYLTKPFHIEELIARLKALLRRANHSPTTALDYPPYTIDTTAQTVMRDKQKLDLTTFEYRLIEFLVRHAGEVLSKQAISDYLYPHDDDADSNVIEVMVGRLRKKLDTDNSIKPIETLRGRGYRFTLSAAGSNE